jgi:hypothetical protein
MFQNGDEKATKQDPSRIQSPLITNGSEDTTKPKYAVGMEQMGPH